MDYENQAAEARLEADRAYRDEDRRFWKTIERCWVLMKGIERQDDAPQAKPARKWFGG